uniref:Tropomyosin n=1 Tax=Lepeophtheirus salmonis TaxID=72036 RepID=C1BUE3_LEPSM|nr:Tropomyosin [Lepeophtheirus salmonis]
MDSIKKKMQSLQTETNAALSRANEMEKIASNANKKADKNDELVREPHRKTHLIEVTFDETLETLNSTLTKLEEKEVSLAIQEEEIFAMARRLALLEDEQKKTDQKIGVVITDLAKFSQTADSIFRKSKQLEQRNIQDEEIMEQMEGQTREAKRMGDDSDQKLDEMTRRLGVMMEELRRSEERAEQAETTIKELEDELRAVGESMMALEISEEKANTREERFKDQIKALLEKLKGAEGRYEYGEMNITKLNHRVDDLEDEIYREKLKIKNISDDLDDTFDAIMTRY